MRTVNLFSFAHIDVNFPNRAITKSGKSLEVQLRHLAFSNHCASLIRSQRHLSMEATHITIRRASEARTLWPTMQNFCLVSMGLGKPSSGTDRDKSVYDDALFTNVVLPLIPRATLALKVPAGVFKVQNLVEI